MKIMIAVPSGEFVYADTSLCLATMCISHVKAFPEHEFILASPKTAYIQNSRNLVARKACEAECTHLMMIDSDMTFPQNTLTRLLEADKDVVGVAYHRRKPPYTLLGQPKAGPGYHGGVIEMEWIATGITLFKTSVFSRMPFPWFECPRGTQPDGVTLNEDATGEDIYFCREAPKHGISIWCDIPLSHSVSHLGVINVNGETSARLNA